MEWWLFLMRLIMGAPLSDEGGQKVQQVTEAPREESREKYAVAEDWKQKPN